jgi:23S rRNA (cytosine1962-C5)-methyltransferase
MSVSVILKSGRDKSVRQRHPRLFSGGIKQIDGKPKDGDIVEVRDNKGDWLARGVINQQSQTAVRLLTWNADEAIDEHFWRARVQAAIQLRQRDPNLMRTDARRVLFGESDGAPGVIADDYAGVLVVEWSALCALRAREAILAALRDSLQPKHIVERYDAERLKHEGVRPPATANENAPTEIEIQEDGLRYVVDLRGGQKTGFYLDQRANRAHVARYARGATMLNTFCYSGGFSVQALAHGAKHVINVDSSADALTLATRNHELNRDKFGGTFECVAADVFDDLRIRRESSESFDLIVLDPPKFAHNPNQIDRAARAYKDLNRIGMSLIKSGGVLATFSCSGVIDAALFQKIVFSAALEANRNVCIVEHLSQASDHPILLTYPESAYLKGLICIVN